VLSQTRNYLISFEKRLLKELETLDFTSVGKVLSIFDDIANSDPLYMKIFLLFRELYERHAKIHSDTIKMLETQNKQLRSKYDEKFSIIEKSLKQQISENKSLQLLMQQ
jgi:hypothetical protein